MGCGLSNRPSMNSPPCRLHNMKQQSGYVEARRSTGAGERKSISKGRGERNSNVAAETKTEVVDGWPKWLTDNIPREVLKDIVPKSSDSYIKIDKIVTKVDFDFPHSVTIEGSANGLLFLVNVDTIYICNLITREYIELHCSKPPYHLVGVHTFGFGEHKLVRIFSLRSNICQLKCYVYTLGTGSWRSVEADASLHYGCFSFGAFLNGNLHWLASCSNGSIVSCFDLETECFSTFLVPPLQKGGGGGRIIRYLYVLNDRLCLCEDTFEGVINIWVMNECVAEKSWSRDYVIGRGPDFDSERYLDICPIKVFKDGDMLLLWDNEYLHYYSNKTKTIHRIGIFDAPVSISSMFFAPSFRSLKSFGMEDVISF